MEEHAVAVDAVSSRIRAYREAGITKYRISHGSNNTTRKTTIQTPTIDTSALNHVLDVDVDSMTCTVEPNVPMDRLVHFLLEYGLMPRVVPEFTGITCGGAFNGTGGESSSFKYGFFHESANWVEMVLADGSIVRASNTDNSDLFHGAAESLGTFGVTTLLQLQLMPAAKYVHVRYKRTASIQETVQNIRDAASDDQYNFVDGMLFSSRHGVNVTGTLTNQLPPASSIQTFTGSWDPWYYMHTSTCTSTSKVTQEYVPMYDYLFRYDRGVFWMAKHTFDYFPAIPFTPFTRWLADDFCRPRFLFSSLHGTPFAEEYVIQDLALPYENAEKLINWQAKTLDIWPLWLCPLKGMPGPARTNQNAGDKPCLNIGLWGHPKPSERSTEELNLELEDELARLGGRKWLYALQYYDEAAFWQLYDKAGYDRLREKYRAQDLASIFDKVRRHRPAPSPDTVWSRLARSWPWTGLLGLVVGLRSGLWGRQYTIRGAWPSVEPAKGRSLDARKAV